MALLTTESFDGGTEGAAISTTTTGATAVTAGTGNTLLFASAYAVAGLGFRATLGTTAASLAQFPHTDQSGRVVYRIERFRFTTLSQFRPLCGRSAAANAGHLRLTAAGKLELIGGNGSAIAGSLSSTTLAVGTNYDVEFAITPGTTASDGVLEYRLYAHGSSTPLETVTHSAVQSSSGATVVGVRLGTSATATVATEWGCDNLRVESLTSGWIGPQPVPPTLSLSASNDYAVLDARASVAGMSGALTYAIAPSGTAEQVVSGVFLVPRDPLVDIDYTVTVTESGSALTDSATFTVAAASGATVSDYVILVADGTSYV